MNQQPEGQQITYRATFSPRIPKDTCLGGLEKTGRRIKRCPQVVSESMRKLILKREGLGKLLVCDSQQG